MPEFNIGDLVLCKKNGNTDYDFEGVIEKVYENSAFVSITKNDPQDAINVQDLQNKAVISFKKMKVLVAAPPRPVEPETADSLKVAQ